jgi:hypothetical protein
MRQQAEQVQMVMREKQKHKPQWQQKLLQRHKQPPQQVEQVQKATQARPKQPNN